MIEELTKGDVGEEKDEAGETSICHFFFKDDNADQRSAEAAFAALVHQAVADDLELVEYAFEEFEIKGAAFAREMRSLWEVLRAVTRGEGKRGRNVICVLDGLDECEQVGREKLIDLLEEFYSRLLEEGSGLEGKFYLKFIITTRPGISVQDKLFDLQTIRLRAEDETEAISGDIKIVVEKKISDIGRRRKLTNEQQRELIDYLVGNADRTFLWVSLVIESIEKSPRFSKESLKQLIQTTPSDLSGIYEKILSETTDTADARKMLGFVVGAYRPLTIDELNLAFVIRPKDRDYADLDLEPDLESTIKSLCGIFLRITNSTVYLAHQTAREFLLAPQDSAELQTSMNALSLTPKGWRHSFIATVQHRLFLDVSTQYLRFKVFEAKPFVPDPKVGDAFKASKMDEYLAPHMMLGYIARFWPMHFSSAKGIIRPSELEKFMWMYATNTVVFRTWFAIYWMTKDGTQGYSYGPEEVTPLLMASYFGHDMVVQKILRSRSTLSRFKIVFKNISNDPVNARDTDQRTALSWAAAEGRNGVVKLLLMEPFVDINTVDSLGYTPLHYACRNGHLEVVEMLLKRFDINSNLIYGWRRSPLQLAAGEGHVEIALLLMARKETDINNKNTHGETPLFHAAAAGSAVIIKALLARPDIDADFNDPKTSPLSSAVKSKSREAFDILLQYAKTSKTGFNLVGALLAAAEAGNLDVFKTLLNIDPTLLNGKNAQGRSSLSIAASEGNTNIVKYLLSLSNVEVNSLDDHKQTPVSWAARQSQVETFNLLSQDARTNVDSLDTYSRHPLHWAICWAGCTDEIVVALLARPDISADHRDRNERTAFHMVCEAGKIALMQLFLARTDVNFNASNSAKMTPLASATVWGHLEACKMLVESGKVQLNTWDDCHESPFTWACSKGHVEIVKYFLTVQEIEFAATNTMGKTGYTIAKEKGKQEVMRVIMLHHFALLGYDLKTLNGNEKVALVQQIKALDNEMKARMPLDLFWNMMEDNTN